MSRALPHAAASSRLPRMIRILLVTLLALALTACGFHLRNALSLPVNLGPVRVSSPDPYSPLAESLADALQRAGAVPATPEMGADVATLQLLSERWADTPIAIDEVGRAQEFSLRYAVIFTLQDASGRQLVPQQAVELSRDYIAPPADSIGRTSERELLVREVRREMSAAILRRVDAALHAVAPASAPQADASTP
jgi:LPS-assembly lipoprotein